MRDSFVQIRFVLCQRGSRDVDAQMEEAGHPAVEGLRAERCAFRVVKEVEEWDASYDVLAERYKFLVLEGPSRTGKTAFARSKCPRGQLVYEVNCSAGGEPSLRDYRFGRDGLILLDEIEPGAVAAQRKLFEAGTAVVQLCTSRTDIHVYNVFVHRVRIVCTSNNWTSSFAQLSANDQAWLKANSVYVYCGEQMWESAA